MVVMLKLIWVPDYGSGVDECGGGSRDSSGFGVCGSDGCHSGNECAGSECGGGSRDSSGFGVCSSDGCHSGNECAGSECGRGRERGVLTVEVDIIEQSTTGDYSMLYVWRRSITCSCTLGSIINILYVLTCIYIFNL